MRDWPWYRSTMTIENGILQMIVGPTAGDLTEDDLDHSGSLCHVNTASLFEKLPKTTHSYPRETSVVPYDEERVKRIG